MRTRIVFSAIIILVLSVILTSCKDVDMTAKAKELIATNYGVPSQNVNLKEIRKNETKHWIVFYTVKTKDGKP